jgi:excisionase family DNA binding protein
MNASNTAERRLLRPPDAARYLSVCKRTLWGLKACGELPYVPIGRQVRYDVRDLDAYIARVKRARHGTMRAATEEAVVVSDGEPEPRA